MKKLFLKSKVNITNAINKDIFKVSGSYGSDVLSTFPVDFSDNKKLIKDKLKQSFDLISSVNKLSYVTLLAKGIGYKVFTPKAKKFLNTVIVKMGFGGSELAWKAPSELRVRAKKTKINNNWLK